MNSSSSLLGLPHKGRLLPLQAFTLVELLALIATLCALALLMVPGRAGTKPQAQALRCLENHRRLMTATSMYQAENQDAFPPVFHGGYTPSSGENRPWVSGWLDWGASTDNTNVAYVTQPRYASLAVYLKGLPNVYRCPADVYLSPMQRARGWTSRARSVSANVYVGTGNAWASVAGGPSGPNNLAIYKGAAKSSDLLIPGPAETFVDIDEHPDSINDGALFPPNAATSVPDAPATYHNGAAGVGFADGHSEIHRWRGPTMNKPRNKNGLLGVGYSIANWAFGRNDPDVLWFSYSAPRRTTRTVAD